jgi:hypothetical protein
MNDDENAPVTEATIRRIIREEIANSQHFTPLVKLAYTMQEAADATGYSLTTLHGFVRVGDIRAGYANSKPVIEKRELLRWLAALPDSPRR